MRSDQFWLCEGIYDALWPVRSMLNYGHIVALAHNKLLANLVLYSPYHFATG